VLAKKATRLPDLTDPTMGGQTRAGVDTDSRYNALALRYNNLLDWIDCVIEGVNSGKKPECKGSN